jgi:hypothetical protein
VGGDVPVDSDVLLVTDFVNLKIKPAQSFRCAHRGRVCVRVFIEVIAHTCMSIYVCTVFLKKPRSKISDLEKANMRCKNKFSIALQQNYDQFTEVTVLPPSFDYWNENEFLSHS